MASNSMGSLRRCADESASVQVITDGRCVTAQQQKQQRRREVMRPLMGGEAVGCCRTDVRRRSARGRGPHAGVVGKKREAAHVDGGESAELGDPALYGRQEGAEYVATDAGRDGHADGFDALTVDLAETIASRLPAESAIFVRSATHLWREAVDKGAASAPTGPLPAEKNGARLCMALAREGRLDQLKWLLRANGGRWRSLIFDQAARGGQIHVLEWMASQENNGTRCADPFASEMAAGGGHMDVLKWLDANGYARGAGTFNAAARWGQLHLLPWLRAEGCPWNESACDQAAEGGHLTVLQWLTSHRCPCNTRTVAAAAARGGHKEILTWLQGRQQRCLLLVGDVPVSQQDESQHTKQ